MVKMFLSILNTYVMTLHLVLQLSRKAASVRKRWHFVLRCACVERRADHHPPSSAAFHFLTVNTPAVPMLLSHLPTLACSWRNISVPLFLPCSLKSWKVHLYKAMASTFFMSKIYGVMYLLLAWLLLNLEIKQSDTEYIALSIGFAQVKNADHAMSIPWVQKHYFTTWVVDT